MISTKVSPQPDLLGNSGEWIVPVCSALRWVGEAFIYHSHQSVIGYGPPSQGMGCYNLPGFSVPKEGDSCELLLAANTLSKCGWDVVGRELQSRKTGSGWDTRSICLRGQMAVVIPMLDHQPGTDPEGIWTSLSHALWVNAGSSWLLNRWTFQWWI